MLLPQIYIYYIIIFYTSFQGNLSISWSVLQPIEDIAGFHVSIRNRSNQIIMEHHIPYDYRTDSIIWDEICHGNCPNLELCVLSKNSHGLINRWFDTQCIYLPNDLLQIREKYTYNNNQKYVIYSARTQSIDKINWGSSNSASFFNISRQIQILILLTILLST